MLKSSSIIKISIMYKPQILAIIAGILLYSCSKDKIPPTTSNPNNEVETGWLVPVDQLVISQLPADRIQSIDTPHFEKLSNTNLLDNDIAYVYRWENTVKIYSQRIIWGHEIVNDNIDNHFFAITYCPLTGSAVAWNRDINGQVTEFGVSGHLYNDNLIPYDRNTSSYWSQMLMQGIKGNHGGDNLESNMLLSTTGSTIKKAFPNALVLVDTTGHVCNDSICTSSNHIYNDSDAGNSTKTSLNSDLFGIINLGVANGGNGALLFNYDLFDDSIRIYKTNFKNSKIIVAGSRAMEFIVAFIDNTGESNIQFYPVQEALPVIMQDNNGNGYDITGLIVSGPSAGDRLPSPTSYSAHSFAWDLFFGDNSIIYQE